MGGGQTERSSDSAARQVRKHAAACRKSLQERVDTLALQWLQGLQGSRVTLKFCMCIDLKKKSKSARVSTMTALNFSLPSPQRGLNLRLYPWLPG